ncbi:hypothetical protein BBJ28_00025682, partial [Nothophytophthora sp. Chile5]
VSVKDIACAEPEWRGCCESNAKQIRRGDLYASSNVHEEGGMKRKVVATSQLEGFHSALKNLLARNVSPELGLRILDCFIIRHNLDIGARFGRNPWFGGVDLITTGRAAMLCSDSMPSSPQMEYMMQLISTPLSPPQYRSETTPNFDFSLWDRMFQAARVDNTCLEANLNRSRQHLSSIKELLLNNATTIQSGKFNREEFFHSLRLPTNPERAGSPNPAIPDASQIERCY